MLHRPNYTMGCSASQGDLETQIRNAEQEYIARIKRTEDNAENQLRKQDEENAKKIELLNEENVAKINAIEKEYKEKLKALDVDLSSKLSGAQAEIELLRGSKAEISKKRAEENEQYRLRLAEEEAARARDAVLAEEKMFEIQRDANARIMAAELSAKLLVESIEEISSARVKKAEGELAVLKALQAEAKRKAIEEDARRRRIPDIKTGYLEKQGHKYKTWNSRYFVIRRGQIAYYESPGFGVVADIPSSNDYGVNLKGEIPTLSGMFISVQGNVVTIAGGREKSITIRFEKNESELQEWVDAIQSHIDYATYVSKNPLPFVEENESVPECMTGYMEKLGRAHKTWNSRYFVLVRGKLSYYEKGLGGVVSNGDSARISGVNYRGELTTLAGMAISVHDGIVTLEGGKERSMSLRFANDSEKAQWLKAFEAHIEYSNYHYI